MQVKVVNCDPWIQPTPTVVIRKRIHRQHGVLIAGTARASYDKSPVAGAIVRLRIFGESAAPEAVAKTHQNGGGCVMSTAAGWEGPFAVARSVAPGCRRPPPSVSSCSTTP